MVKSCQQNVLQMPAAIHYRCHQHGNCFANQDSSHTTERQWGFQSRRVHRAVLADVLPDETGVVTLQLGQIMLLCEPS